MFFPFAMLIAGVLFFASGYKKETFKELLSGEPDSNSSKNQADPLLPTEGDAANRDEITLDDASSGFGRFPFLSTSLNENLLSKVKIPKGATPKFIIDKFVLPVARANGIKVTPESVAAANARHGATVSGNRSDHQGPPNQAWAADMSNGTAPTKQMDHLARELATMFAIPWHGSGLVTVVHAGYQIQLIYRTNEGGNHFNHVHFGLHRV